MGEDNTTKTTTIGELAARVEQAALQRQRDLQLEKFAEGLHTRLAELSQEGSSIRAITRSAHVLRQHGMPPWERRSRSSLASVVRKISKLQGDFQQDPHAITKANAICTDDLRHLGSLLQQELLSFWRGYVERTMPSEGILGIFEKHVRFRAPIAGLRGLKAKLDTLARSLPHTGEELQAVRAIQEEVKIEIAKLPELTAKSRTFLQASVSTGVLLSDLLADDELLEWLRKQRMDMELRVFSGQGGLYQR